MHFKSLWHIGTSEAHQIANMFTSKHIYSIGPVVLENELKQAPSAPVGINIHDLDSAVLHFFPLASDWIKL